MCGIFGTINYRISEETFKHRLDFLGGYSFDIPSKLSDEFPIVFKMRDTLQTLEDMGGYGRI